MSTPCSLQTPFSCAPPGASAGLSPDPTGSASSAWSPAPNHPDTSLVVCGPDVPRTPGTSAQPLGCLPLWPSGCASPNEENTFAPCDEALWPRRLPHPRPRRHPALRRTQQRLVDITKHSISARTGARSWRRTRAMVLQRHGHHCVIRGPHCEISAVEVDHVQPVSEGGSDDPDNCQSSCGPCHAAKTASQAAHGRNRWTDTPPTTSAAGPKADHYDQRTNPAREPGPCAAGTSTGSRGRRSSTDRPSLPSACLRPESTRHRKTR